VIAKSLDVRREISMSIEQIKEILWREIRGLRADLVDLKRCQMQYFTLAVTSTGAILGLVAVLGNNTIPKEALGMALLAPLAVILPCWLIFFDKATTITRIVGYQRILEEQQFATTELYAFLGYERALAKFRLEEGETWRLLQGRKPIDTTNQFWRFIKSFFLATRHRYWTLNWYTFLGLSLFSTVRAHSFFEEANFYWGRSGFAVVALCASYTIYIVWTLTYGRRSYDASTDIWKVILARNNTDIQPHAAADAPQAARL
jgi:hypothetical protein